MALSTTQFEQLKTKLAAQRAEREAVVKSEGEKAEKFVSKSLPEQLFSVETARELPKEALNVLIGGPARALTSAFEAVEQPLKGTTAATGREYNLPGLKPFKSFQSQASETAGKIIEGEKPLYHALAPFAEVPLAVAETVGLGEGVRGGVRLLKGTTKASGEFLSSLVKSVKGGGGDIPPGGSGGSNVVSRSLKYAGEKTGLTKYLSEKNVGEQAKTAFETGKATLKKDYEDFYDMTQKQIKNAKLDTALNKVGNEAGKAFDKVIAVRQKVGKKMGSELEKIGGVKSDITEAFTTFEKRLKDEAGMIYDQTKQSLVSLGKQTKMTGEEKTMLSNFIEEVNRLGTSPTVKELDSFLSRIPKEMDVYKAKAGLKTTHAESLVKNTLSNMRKAFDPKKNPAFKAYAEARKAYSNLSEFLDEGVGFLGKKTLSGDYAKDASLLKSSVQSLLNNGKKDFLIQLEKLSGYPAIDKAVVALQAMKDAGDFKGLSLLETLAGKGAQSGTFADIPTSAKGLIDRTLSFALDKAGQIVGGSPKERTLRVIRDLTK